VTVTQCGAGASDHCVEAFGPPVPRPLALSRAQLVVLDTGAAMAFTALLLTFALSGRHPAPDVPGWAVWLVEAGVGLPVATRRLWPVAAFLAALTASLIAALLGLQYGYFASAAAGLSLVALTGRGPARLSASGAGLLAGAAVLAASVAGSRSGAGTAVVIGVAAMAGAWAVGQAVRDRRAHLRAEAERLAERAVSEERLRIARELHDVVAHSMSLIAVKAGVANHVARSRPAETADALPPSRSRPGRDAGAGARLRRRVRRRLPERERLTGQGPPPLSGRGVMSTPIRVLIADDQALVRGSFRVLVETAPGLMVVGEAATGLEAVEMTHSERPDVILMDVRMPEMDGIEATRRICACPGARARVLILTTFDLDAYVYGALRAGASGFLLKDTTPASLLDAIAVVAAGDALLAPAITRRLIGEFARRPQPSQPITRDLAGATSREREVLTLIATGLSNAEIAKHLHLSPATVKTHIARLLDKLSARDRAQLVITAYETGLVSPTPQQP